MAKLTEKQRRFVEEYLVDLCATQAAIRAGYSPKTAYSIGEENLRKPEIREEIDKALADRSRRTGINQDRALREFARIALVNVADVINLEDCTIKPDASPDDLAAIASYKVKIIPTPNGDIIEREVRFFDKIRALELLGKHLGMFKETYNLNVGVQIIDDLGAEGDDEEAAG